MREIAVGKSDCNQFSDPLVDNPLAGGAALRRYGNGDHVNSPVLVLYVWKHGCLFLSRPMEIVSVL